MDKQLYFFASFGQMKKLPAGGGQTAARRLWHTLEKMGYKVSVYNRHRYYWFKWPFNRILIYVFEILDPIWMLLVLLFKRRKNAAFLYMSYAGKLACFDFLMALSAKITGHKAIMYLAGGLAQNYYHREGAVYKLVFRTTMKMFDLVMCEGEVNVDLVDKVSNKKTKTFYLPNFSEDGFAPEYFPSKPTDKINILYFGRIEAVKNVLLGIEIFNKLCERYDNFTYTIIGAGHLEYEKMVAEAIEKSSNKNKIERIGWSSHEEIIDAMKTKHFYLFPSAEPCEGHSNALNEAMSWGLIPIVSNNNFLPSIVGDAELVVDSYDSDDYVNAISRLFDNNLLTEKSKQMYERVQNNFTQSVVEKRLKMILKEIV